MTKLKTVSRKIKTTAKKAGRFIATSLLVAGLMLTPGALIAKKKAQLPKPKPAVASLIGGVYGKGNDHYLGIGLKKSFNFGLFGIDAYGEIGAVGSRVDVNGELDITLKIAKMLAVTAYGYRSAYYGVEAGVGGVAHIGNFHIGSEWEKCGAVPVFAFYNLKLLKGKLRIQPKIIYVTNKNNLGGNLRIEADVARGVTLFGQVFSMNSMDAGKPLALNAQAGISFPLR